MIWIIDSLMLLKNGTPKEIKERRQIRFAIAQQWRFGGNTEGAVTNGLHRYEDGQLMRLAVRNAENRENSIRLLAKLIEWGFIFGRTQRSSPAESTGIFQRPDCGKLRLRPQHRDPDTSAGSKQRGDMERCPAHDGTGCVWRTVSQIANSICFSDAWLCANHSGNSCKQYQYASGMEHLLWTVYCRRSNSVSAISIL